MIKLAHHPRALGLKKTDPGLNSLERLTGSYGESPQVLAFLFPTVVQY